MSGIRHLSQSIISDLKKRFPEQRKTQRECLGMLVAIMLEVRSANTSDLAAALPRNTERHDMRSQWVARVLKNPRIQVSHVMAVYAQEVLRKLFASGQKLVFLMDQSQVKGGYEMLMVAVRMGERALPLLWLVKKTEGEIGFSLQKKLLQTVFSWIPKGASVILMADRFYGTVELLSWCRKKDWDYRIRLKGNLIVHQGTKKTYTGQMEPGFYENLTLTDQGAHTNLGIVHEEGHPEAWIIAMAGTPSKYTTLDYGLRWGIEAMFSDFKSRGFGITQTQLKSSDRMERLVLVMTIALYWAVSTGMWEAQDKPMPFEKKRRRAG
jgi:hypothetical protein